jgi:hypothetical protein
MEVLVRSEITEISYSTTLTFELVTQYGFLTLGAPTFPSLRKEAIFKAQAKSTVVPLFIQYKLGDHIIGTASSLKGYWGIPYFRFLLHPKNKVKRHELLFRLQGMGHLVYYTAPEFHSMSGLFEALMSTSVLDNSTFWPPQAIGALKKAERYTIAYKHDTPYGVLQPGNIKIEGALKGEALLEVIKNRFETNRSESFDEERILSLGDEMLEVYRDVFKTTKGQRVSEDIRSARERIDPRDYLSLISVLLYNCYVYLVARD